VLLSRLGMTIILVGVVHPGMIREHKMFEDKPPSDSPNHNKGGGGGCVFATDEYIGSGYPHRGHNRLPRKRWSNLTGQGRIQPRNASSTRRTRNI
jgi:hypothetical protein